MKREFLLNIFFLVLVNFIIKPFYIFGIDARVQNLVGPTEFGVYFVLYDLIFLLQVFNDPGIQSFNSKFISQNRESVNLHLPKVLGLKIVLGGLFLFVSIIVSYILGYTQYHLIAGIAAIFFLSTLYILLRSSLSSLGHFRIDSIFSVLDKIILIIGIGYLVWVSKASNSFSIYDFVYSQVLCYIVALIVISIALIKLKVKVNPEFDIAGFKNILLQSLPYSLIILLTTAYMRIDAIMIEKLLPDGFLQSGLYAAGYRFVDAANMVGYIFGSLLLPMYAYLISTKENLQKLFSIAFRMLLVIGLSLTLVSLFYSKEIFQWIYTDDYSNSSQTMSILMLSVIPLAISHSLGSLLQAASKVKALNILLLGGLILNVFLNVFFIPKWGANGAAWSTFITEMCLLFGLIYIASESKIVAIDAEIYKPSILILCVAFPLFYILKTYSTFNWIVSLLISVLIYGFLILATKIIQKEEILSFFKSSNLK